MVPTWDDSDKEISYKEESYEVRNLAFMAIGEELDEINNIPSCNTLIPLTRHYGRIEVNRISLFSYLKLSK